MSFSYYDSLYNFLYPMYPTYEDYYPSGGYNIPRGNSKYAISPTRENIETYPWLFMDKLGKKNETTKTNEGDQLTKKGGEETKITPDIDQIKKYLKADSVVKPITKANDGKFSLTEAGKNFGKGLISPITTLISSKENALIGGSMIVGAAALGILCSPAGVVMAAVGLYSAAGIVGKGVVQLANAKNGDDVEKAAGTFGLGTFAGVTSYFGAKSALKYGVAKGGVKVGGMKETGAEAVEAVNKMGFKKAALKTMDPRTIISAFKNMFGKTQKKTPKVTTTITEGVSPKPKTGDVDTHKPINPDDLAPDIRKNINKTGSSEKSGQRPPGLHEETGIKNSNSQKLIGQSTNNSTKGENAVVKVELDAIDAEALPNNDAQTKYYYEPKTQREIPEGNTHKQIDHKKPSLTDNSEGTLKVTTSAPENGLPDYHKNLEFEQTYKSILEERVQGLTKKLNNTRKNTKQYDLLKDKIQRLKTEISSSDKKIKSNFDFFKEHGYDPSENQVITQMKIELDNIKADWLKLKLKDSKKLSLNEKVELNKLDKKFVELFQKYTQAVDAERKAAAGANMADNIAPTAKEAGGLAGSADDLAGGTANADDGLFNPNEFEQAFSENFEGAPGVAKVANVMDDAAAGNKTNMTFEELDIQENSQPIPENFDLDNPFGTQGGQVLNNIDNTNPPQNGAGIGENVTGQDVASRIDALFGNSHKINPKQAKLRHIQETAHSMEKSINNLKAKINKIDKQIDNAEVSNEYVWNLVDERNLLESQLKYLEYDLQNYYHSVLASRKRIKPINMENKASNANSGASGNSTAQHKDNASPKTNKGETTEPANEVDISEQIKALADKWNDLFHID